jgi:hypothetical protein
MFARHATQLPSGEHSLLSVMDAQSVLVRHCTHWLVAVSQRASIPEHWAFDVQPARQVKSCGSQIGSADRNRRC